jgi:hypothetical protein
MAILRSGRIANPTLLQTSSITGIPPLGSEGLRPRVPRPKPEGLQLAKLSTYLRCYMYTVYYLCNVAYCNIFTHIHMQTHRNMDVAVKQTEREIERESLLET